MIVAKIADAKNTKAFTLVEILIVVFLLGMITVIATTSYINSTRTFSFLAQYKSILSEIRMARTFAINNRQNNGAVPPRYGVFVSGNSMTGTDFCMIVFADNGANPFKFEASNAANYTALPNCVSASAKVATGADSIVETLPLAKAETKLVSQYPPNHTLTLPYVIYFESGSGDVSVFYDVDGASPVYLDKNTNKYISIQVCDKDCTAQDNKKYIVMFQASGLVEEANDLNDL